MWILAGEQEGQPWGGAEKEACSLSISGELRKYQENSQGSGRSDCRGESRKEEEVGIAFVHVSHRTRREMGEQVPA